MQSGGQKNICCPHGAPVHSPAGRIISGNTGVIAGKGDAPSVHFIPITLREIPAAVTGRPGPSPYRHAVISLNRHLEMNPYRVPRVEQRNAAITVQVQVRYSNGAARPRIGSDAVIHLGLDALPARLDKGAKVDLKDKNDATALTMAALLGNTDVVSALIESGAKVDHKAQNGFTPLILAAQNGHAPIIEILLGKGAKIDLQNDDGVTPLMWAALHGHTDSVKALLSHGANRTVKSKSGKAALEITKDPDIIELLNAQ